MSGQPPRDDEGRFAPDQERAADRAVNELPRRGRRVHVAREQSPGDRGMNDWIRRRGRPAQPEERVEGKDTEQREQASALSRRRSARSICAGRTAS